MTTDPNRAPQSSGSTDVQVVERVASLLAQHETRAIARALTATKETQTLFRQIKDDLRYLQSAIDARFDAYGLELDTLLAAVQESSARLGKSEEHQRAMTAQIAELDRCSESMQAQIHSILSRIDTDELCLKQRREAIAMLERRMDEHQTWIAAQPSITDVQRLIVLVNRMLSYLGLNEDGRHD